MNLKINLKNNNYCRINKGDCGCPCLICGAGLWFCKYYNVRLENVGEMNDPKIKRPEKCKQNKLNEKELYAWLMANNQIFYDYLAANISIGKLCKDIVRIVKEVINEEV